ncbi:tannase/feruloyl esterase family alpha/beta hydrolase [Variovorax paradoxus]|nr:tannase/feruloyl esterase family alpha/beta hydrolase [Variovorax paradoxus]
MRHSKHRNPQVLHATLPILAAMLSACGGGSEATLPQLAAAPASLLSCADLAGRIAFPNTNITSASVQAAGSITVAGALVEEHCKITGRMHERVGPVDGQTYAIGFEMRLPKNWNGRFFHQTNGGTDGNIVTASGGIGGGGPLLSNGLRQGFAVLSSDAGHTSSQNPLFGLDPQARLDYGYQAVGKLTPMAKSVIHTAYGKDPDRSYLVGCSNGGRHALVGAARYADQYDGILAGHPGFNLPKSNIAMLHTAQQFNTVATDPQDLSSAFTQTERNLVSRKILDKCDALDGAVDGMVHDSKACQSAFVLDRDVLTCSGARDGSCLSAAQKTAVRNVFNGPRDSAGAALYTSFPYDPGLTSSNWKSWRFVFPITLSAVNMAFIFQTPPKPVSVLNDQKGFALAFDMDIDAPKINASNATYTESAQAFMTPPNPNDLSRLRDRGAKLIIYHGLADGTFSTDDTTAWYESLRAANVRDVNDFSRLFLVPGMNHCGGGPAADQFDLVTALVNWVEKGQAPDGLIASARGVGNPGGVNAELPADWSAQRTRPLCSYPKIARYKGTGDIESAASFVCQ